MTKRLLLTLSCFYSIALFAQQAPIGVIPTYYNSGFAGEAGAPRLSTFSFLTKYRGTNDAAIYGNYISYDDFMKKIRSGVSFTVGHMNQHFDGNNQSGNKFLSAAISPKFSFNGKYTLAPFVRFTLAGGKADYITSSNPDGIELKSLYGNVSTGVLFNSSKWYVGFTVGHLKHTFYKKGPFPEQDFVKYQSPKVNWSFQAGYTFQRTPESKFSFTPQIALAPYSYSYTHSFTVDGVTVENTISDKGVRIDDLNLMFRYSKVIAGFNIQAPELDGSFFDLWSEPNITAGYQTKDFRIMLNQNYFHGGVYQWNLGLRYVFPKRTTAGPVSIR